MISFQFLLLDFPLGIWPESLLSTQDTESEKGEQEGLLDPLGPPLADPGPPIFQHPTAPESEMQQ